MKRCTFLIEGLILAIIILTGISGLYAEIDLEEPILNSQGELLNYLEEANLLTELELTREKADAALIKILERLSTEPLERHLTDGVILNELPQPIRVPAEYEQMEAILLRWPFLMPYALTTPPQLWQTYKEMTKTLMPEGRVYIVVSNKWQQAGIILYLQQKGIAVGNIRFLHLPSDNIWIRDYGPNLVYVGSDKMPVVIGADYHPPEEPYRAKNNAFPLAFARYFGKHFINLPLATEWGNFMTDGKDTVFMIESIFDRNPELTNVKLEEIMLKYFGFSRTIVLPQLELDYLGHIDLCAKIIKDNTILVGKLSANYSDAKILDIIADKLSKIKSASGDYYKIIRIKEPGPLYIEGFKPIFRSYMNSLIFNNIVLVPLFGVDEDEQALAVYREALPNHRVIGINSQALVRVGGTIHCVTKQIPSIKKGEIRYAK